MSLVALLLLFAQQVGHCDELVLPVADQRDAITVTGQHVQQWRQGEYEMWLLEGGCQIKQGTTVASSEGAVLWVRRASNSSTEASKIIAYLETDVRLDFGRSSDPHRVSGKASQSFQDRTWFGRFHTVDDITLRSPDVAPGAPPKSLLLAHAQQAWKREFAVQQAQYSVPSPPLMQTNPQFAQAPAFAQPPAGQPFAGSPADGQQPFIPPQANGPTNLLPAPPNGLLNGPPVVPNFAPPADGANLNPPPSGAPLFAPPPPTGIPGAPATTRPYAKFTKIESRNSVGFNAKSFPGGITIDTGVRLVAEGIQNAGFAGYTVTRFDIEADRVVIWADPMDLRTGGGPPAAGETNTGRPIEVYLEGNIVFREGDRVIYADRMYYNITEHYGVVLNAEVLTPIPETKGFARLRADVLQQLDEQRFQAFGAAMTTSRLGVPKYWLQSENISFESTNRPAVEKYTGQPILDPQTGQQQFEQHSVATSRNNWVFLGGFPVFYWPTIATDLKEPSYFLNSISVNSDRIFGQQVRADFNMYQLLGIRNQPTGTSWGLQTDYFSRRGPGAGTDFIYNRDSFFGYGGPVTGRIDAWGIYDQGTDNLGSDRRVVPVEDPFRGRLLWQHRQVFGDGYYLTGELGLISDRNFLEQYYEQDWDNKKDESTGIELKRYTENASWNITGDVRLNQFFTQTNWLPRLDHFTLGQSLLGDNIIWHEHSSVGYAKMQVASTPNNPVDLAKFSILPWEANVEGVRANTRQELEVPVEVGPIKIVPYVLGDLTFWGEDLNGQAETRAFGQAGLRASLPMWRTDADFQSELFNINGLAHKIVWESELFYADTNKHLNQQALYDAIDDDAIEQFRRRLFFNTFGQTVGGQIPPQFDARYYALRSGIQSWVTSPSTEIADRIAIGRLQMKNRWQTKRGLPGQQRIVDLLVLDLGASFFPDPNRDNFGKTVGMMDYDLRWHVGDRVSILSDGYADVFNSGLKTVQLGGLLTRPEYGSAFLSFRTIEGPITSNVVSVLLNYRAAEKWIFTAGTSYDFSKTGNIGQLLNFTRVGESFLIKMGFNVDVSRGNFGLNLGIEPRFAPNSRLGQVGGVTLPTTGALGLE